MRCIFRGVGQEGGAEETMSPESSRRITTTACSVAQQVERAVCAAVQAISPGLSLAPPPPTPPPPPVQTFCLCLGTSHTHMGTPEQARVEYT